MLQKDKLCSFYIKQYEKSAHRKFSKVSERSRGYEEQINSLCRNIRRISRGRVAIGQLVYYRGQINYLLTLAVRNKNQKLKTRLCKEAIPYLMELDLSMLSKQDVQELDEAFIAFAEANYDKKICSKTLLELLMLYKENRMKQQMSQLVPLRPEMEFLQALEMKRHFIFHIGPTNSGKTFQALEKLKTAKRGIYLGPLRLLALEVYEKMQECGTPCTMLTGQERIEDAGSRVVAATIEMLDMEQSYDIAVIDEAQMIADSDRGHSWTRAVLGIRAKEIHICMSAAAETVISHLVLLCKDTCEICRYDRKVPLICEDKPFEFPRDVKSGDALIVFSKKSVLDVAGRLEARGISASVIYGSLPPEIRRKQMKLFNKGVNRVVVSTDAIGMGLNLPVRRIVFIEAEKFDGVQRRKLKAPEAKQIAGRAGRFGIYDTGYVTAMGEEALEHIRNMCLEEEPQLEKVTLGFPQILLSLPDPLDDIMNTWHKVEASQPFEKISIDEILFLYHKAEKRREYIDGFDDKNILYRMVTCPIDIQNQKVVSLWLRYCETYSADVRMKRPDIRQLRFEGIAKYESYYKQLDLYYQFSDQFGKEIETEWLAKERAATEIAIMKCLSKGKETYIATCRYCGHVLPVGYGIPYCRQCRSMIQNEQKNS